MTTKIRGRRLDVLWWSYWAIIKWGVWPSDWKKPMFSFLHIGPVEFRLWRGEPYERGFDVI